MSDAMQVARTALAGWPAWLVGGVVRDHALGRPTTDIDVVIEGNAGEAARAMGKAGHAASFALSEKFGAWRVSARDGSWQIDVESMRGGSLQSDLRLRDFTINAVAQPLQGGAPIDPLGGLDDLAASRLRMVSDSVFSDDPLRILRLVRFVVELGLVADSQTADRARKCVSRLESISAERTFMELRRVVGAAEAVEGLKLMDELDITPVVLPELDALHGVQQNRFHHCDVHGHTMEVLEGVMALEADPGAVLGSEYAQAIAELLAEPLADELTRGGALRWGALLHDAAKPLTRGVNPDNGRVTFVGHDAQGATLARSVLGRLRTSERLRSHVAALTRHHLRLGFLVHEPQPLACESVFDYLSACEPVGVDVTLLSVADRLATRGEGASKAIAAHMQLAGEVLGDALRWREEGPPRPLWRGDELARALGIELGPQIGGLLDQLARAQYAGRVSTSEQALAFARKLRSGES